MFQQQHFELFAVEPVELPAAGRSSVFVRAKLRGMFAKVAGETKDRVACYLCFYSGAQRHQTNQRYLYYATKAHSQRK